MTDGKVTDLSKMGEDAPKIEFPCDYRISVMGIAEDNFPEFVVGIVSRHAPDHDGQYTLRDSSKGRFVAVVVNIHATGIEQLKALDTELKQDHRVKMVL